MSDTDSRDLAALRKYTKKPLPKRASMAAKGKPSLRVADYGKHKIEIATAYTVRVDGRKVPVTIEVWQNGNVFCSALPHYSPASAVDLVKMLIDTYPDDFAGSAKRRRAARPQPKKRRAAASGKARRKGG